MGNLALANPHTSSEDSDGEQDEFWPPDMVPHPRPPEQPADDGWAGPNRGG